METTIDLFIFGSYFVMILKIFFKECDNSIDWQNVTKNQKSCSQVRQTEAEWRHNLTWPT